jgi:hypothetical protein
VFQAQKTTPKATPRADATTMSTVRQRADAWSVAVLSVRSVVVVMLSLLSVVDGAAVL